MTAQPILTIDLAAAVANWRALDELSGGAETAVAIKADGYGCGAGVVAEALQGAGCRTFFVATVEEGVALRAGLDAAEIQVLNGVASQADAAACIAHRLQPCLNHLGEVETWQKAGGGGCTVHVDTGMARLGLSLDEIARVPRGLDIRLVMSHLACADEGIAHPANNEQRVRFYGVVAQIRPVAPQARLSLSATGGTLLSQCYHYDVVRCGIGIYGAHPFVDGQPVVSLTAPVLQLRDIPGGVSGRIWLDMDRPAPLAPRNPATGLCRRSAPRAVAWGGALCRWPRGAAGGPGQHGPRDHRRHGPPSDKGRRPGGNPRSASDGGRFGAGGGDNRL